MGKLLSAVDETLTALASRSDVRELENSLLEITEAIDRLQGGRLQCLAQLDEQRIGAVDHGGSTAAWLRELTMCASAAAHRDVYLARDLQALPLLTAALRQGRIGLDHARMIAGLRKDLADEVITAALPELIEAATGKTPETLRPLINDLRHAQAPESLADRERRAYEQRSLSMTAGADVTGSGAWTLPNGMQEIVMTAIHAFSSPIKGDDRSPGQRRADALVTICELVLNGGIAPEAGGVRPHVSVLIPLETLEKRAGAPAARYGFGTEASDEWARRMCCDAGISRIIADAKGEILDSGRTTRTFSAAQRRAIVARDRHCVWPGCDMPAAWCEAHHRVYWSDLGVTSVAEGVLICGRHHDRIHLHRHRILINSDGSRTVDLRRGSADDPDPPDSPGCQPGSEPVSEPPSPPASDPPSRPVPSRGPQPASERGCDP